MWCQMKFISLWIVNYDILSVHNEKWTVNCQEGEVSMHNSGSTAICPWI